MSEERDRRIVRRVTRPGAIIVRAAESRSRMPSGPPRPGYIPPVPSDADRALVRALLAARGRGV